MGEDQHIRAAAFDHVRRLSDTHDHLTSNELKPGFMFQGERIPLVNPQRGIFKPRHHNEGFCSPNFVPSRIAESKLGKLVHNYESC